MNSRLGFVGIVVQDRSLASERINAILHDHGDGILGRMGLPRARGTHSVITLIVDMSTDELGALTGRLGQVEGVQVKSGLAG
ncbi:hypothetical protein PXH66_06820 [Synoicihabitans lomoniglobus]|uniref:CopG family transcriptional regulator n=1 Tax=Synoicihabitans lomoniglobus TaxID=2909285 RepID=A0AAF0CRD3_9BACT|nr:hypothetical protein PXH66_06820 [Opitutaceae bacterium LMO-M01]